MLCDRCKKRTAVVFISTTNGSEIKNEGLCLMCAKEMKLPQVEQYMKQMGITDEELEEFCEMMEPGDNGEAFELGGSDTAPSFLTNLFGNIKDMAENMGISSADAQSEDSSAKDGKKSESGKEKKHDRKKSKRKYLEQYCTDLTKKARDGELDRIIGRDKEIYRVIQILSRRTKNNPCLIGEPGVGKTAVAEGIALKIASGDVPFRLQNKELFLLDLTALVAGTQFRGQFESRIKGLVDEVKSEGNIILFIDEVHNLVGTGDSEGTMNAANLLKPALSRGEVQVIGATTFAEYRKYIEKDSALERRFQPVKIYEPNIEDTVEVLKGIKEYYEKHHRVKVTDGIAEQCAVLSERYITDRFLPDKAIDLLDEACSCAAIKSEALTSYDRLTKEIEAKKEEEASLESEENVDYEKLATVKSEILKTQEELDKIKEEAENIYVTEDDLAKVIELWTGIPARKIMQTELRKIAGLKEALQKKIIGQDEAVELVANAIKRTRVQLSKRRRPASFIFVGPTGVGKTELVKVLAEELFDTVEPLIRLDMSEYMEKHSVAKLIGAPPGYVGYDEAGQLTEKVRRKPYSVVLFDEIEKAHPDVMNILLQILDEGRITDAQGRTVNFENTVIAMTSNAGSSGGYTGMGFEKTKADISKEKAMKGLTEFLRPEFISRVDEIVVFNSLTLEDYEKIACLMLDEYREPLAEKGIDFEYDQSVPKYLAKEAFDDKYGARDIRKHIRKEIEDKIASVIVEADGKPIKKVTVSADSEVRVSCE
ncbi:MAG: AAA family ATPase [Oscillospiraceae bacterium]